MLKSNGPNSISKNALRDEGCPWFINCTIQKYLVNRDKTLTLIRSKIPLPLLAIRVALCIAEDSRPISGLERNFIIAELNQELTEGRN